MKTIARCISLDQAQMVKMRLGSVGIEAFIPNEFSSGVLPGVAFNKKGIMVQVAEEDAEKALELLEEDEDPNRVDE